MKIRNREFPVRFVVVTLTWIFHIAAYLPIYRAIGPIVAALNVIPVTATAWIYGIRGGLLAGAITFPMTILLPYLLSGTVAEMLKLPNILGTILILVLGLFVGRLSDANKNLKAALRRKSEMEDELQERTAEIQHQKQNLEALVQNSPIAIVFLNLDRKIISCNPAFEELFGYRESEVIGKYLDELITQEGVLEDAVKLTHATRRGETFHTSGQRYCKNGTKVDVDIYGVPVIVAEEQVGMLGLYMDISDRKRAEEERAKFTELMIGRELRMIELKREVNEMAKELGKEPPYDLSFIPDDN